MKKLFTVLIPLLLFSCNIEKEVTVIDKSVHYSVVDKVDKFYITYTDTNDSEYTKEIEVEVYNLIKIDDVILVASYSVGDVILLILLVMLTTIGVATAYYYRRIYDCSV